MVKYYIVYRTTNLINGRYYIGSHHTFKIEDGYLGSGVILKKALRKYGRSNFSREVICFCTSYEAMREVETCFVKYHLDNFASRCYNISYSGTGAMLGELNSFYGKTHTDETKEKLSELAKGRMAGENNPFYGKKHTYETIQKLKEGRPNSEDCLNMRNMFVAKSNYWWCTPWGCFYSDRYAAKVSGGYLSRCGIRNRCKNQNKVVNPAYNIDEKYWGKSWEDNGYYIIDKTSSK